MNISGKSKQRARTPGALLFHAFPSLYGTGIAVKPGTLASSDGTVEGALDHLQLLLPGQAAEIAAAKNPDGTAIVPEVCIFFENHLMRGNRTTKINAENFNAFRSFNYPPLARVGIHIKYEPHLIRKPDPTKPLKPHYLFDTNVVILTLFPGIQESIVTSLLHVPGLKAVVMKTFGSGNAPQKEWFIRQLKEATDRGIIIVNITQCASGAVEMGRYETGMHLLEAGVISGYDSTPECAITKLMFLLGHGLPNKDIRYKMNSCLIGEITKS